MPKADRILLVLAVILAASAVPSDAEIEAEVGGHVKPSASLTLYPDGGFFDEIIGSTSADFDLDARVNLDLAAGNWAFEGDWQMIGIAGDRLELASLLPPSAAALAAGVPTDDARYLDLSHTITASENRVLVHRLDRLSATWSGDRVVARIGRQAVSWGNGLVFTVMDIFNPFDPTLVDTEYKSGDDMLYGQFLRSGGDDLQGVAVVRRDPLTGTARSDVHSWALKYHGMLEAGEFDLLAARHYGEDLIAAGGSFPLGGAVVQGDALAVDAVGGTVVSAVANLSYSWTWGGTNFSGVAEYFHNGFGRSDGCYDVLCLAAEPALLERVARGEVFTLGRSYLGLSAQVELHPLVLLMPNLLVNLDDESALLQFVLRGDLREDLVLLVSLNLPLGPEGTEFGGLPSGPSGATFATDATLSVQLGWYW